MKGMMMKTTHNPLRKATSIILIFALMLPGGLVFAQDEPTKDYYYEGQAAAQSDYSGGGATLGGLGAGFLLGLIGWGIGYLIIANQNVEVPHHYVTDLNTTQRMQFEEGYKNTVLKTRKGKYNVGAGIGTLIAVVYVLNASSEEP